MPPDDDRGLDLGPDPHLNERGVRLSRAQWRVLARIGVVIGGLLVLAVVGLVAAFPPAHAVAATTQVIVEGDGRAEVTVLQDGLRTERGEVPLPHAIPVARDVAVVTVQVRPAGTGCALQGERSGSVQQRRSAAALQCAVALG